MSIDVAQQANTVEVVTPAVPPVSSVVPSSGRGFLSVWTKWLIRGGTHAGEWGFGLLSMIGILAVLATIPVIQLLSLGYLLESGARIARSGRLRAGFIGIRQAARIGSFVVGTWLVLWPARIVSGLWYSSLVINGPGPTTTRWRLGLVAIASLTVAHLAWAWLRGGRFRHFLWPAPRHFWRCLRQGNLLGPAQVAFRKTVRGFRLPHYFSLGLRGALGAMIWLFVPVSFLILAARLPVPASVFAGLLGGLLFATILLYLPFLQIRFACYNEWQQWFLIRAVRRDFARAPLAYWSAFVATLLLAIPLYLLKAELIPREAVWLPSLVFVVFIWPARMLTGWALARAERHAAYRHWLIRWPARLAFLPIAAFYVLVVYFTQFISWHGGWSLYEQHAFLVPVPFLGL